MKFIKYKLCYDGHGYSYTKKANKTNQIRVLTAEDRQLQKSDGNNKIEDL